MMRDFFSFAAIQFLVYSLAVVNIRSVAQAGYVGTALSDVAIAYMQFTIIKKIAAAEGGAARAGYIFGGVAGSLVTIYVTKRLFGA